LHHGLLPLLDVILEQPMGERFVMLSLANTDARIKADKPVSPGFLFATLLWHEVLANWEQRKARKEASTLALFAAMDDVLDKQGEKMAITRRIVGDIKDIWALQPRFEQNAGRRPLRLIEQPRFRAGYDFLLLRVASGELPQELGDWWTRFIAADTDERQAMLTPEPGGLRRRRRGPRRSRTDAAETGLPLAGQAAES
jgi:poly(A) polymerase